MVVSFLLFLIVGVTQWYLGYSVGYFYGRKEEAKKYERILRGIIE